MGRLSRSRRCHCEAVLRGSIDSWLYQRTKHPAHSVQLSIATGFENVPTRVIDEIGKQYFAPETVVQLRKKIRGNEMPKKTHVFDYSD